MAENGIASLKSEMRRGRKAAAGPAQHPQAGYIRLDRLPFPLEQPPKIKRNVQRFRNCRGALSFWTGVSPPASSALPCAPCPRFLFSHDFWELL